MVDFPALDAPLRTITLGVMTGRARRWSRERDGPARTHRPGQGTQQLVQPARGRWSEDPPGLGREVVGEVLDPLPPGDTVGGERAVGAEPPAGHEPGLGRLPLLVGPAGARPGAARGGRRRWPEGYVGIDPAEPGGHVGQHVAVTPVLAQEGGGVPEPGERLGGPRQGGQGGEERPTGGGTRVHRRLGQRRGLGHVGLLGERAQHRSERGDRALEASVEQRGGLRPGPHVGQGARRDHGRKLKNVAVTSSAPASPNGAEREAK